MYLIAAMTTALLHLLLSFSLFSTAAPPSSPALPPAPNNCSDELVTFSICLPYVSAYPNNLTRLPSSQCCHDVTSAVTSGAAVCFCHLIRQPLMLGFPLNATRLLSLTTLCRVKIGTNMTTFSLDSLCSGLPTLPPLQSITGPGGHREENTPSSRTPDGRSKQNSGTGNPPPPPRSSETATNDTEETAPMPEPADDYFDFEQHVSAANIVTQPSLSANVGRTGIRLRWFLPQIIILALHLSTYL
ncbi:hypothetical protein M9H77_35199 [Catharanthus roseus]|uniref:Uncharacterized protein n=1 Tax=Catharanthus roseus TaxID=4058 RepID=A0ACB9ZP84_CATRO|nr:hypothetical protein M9H77_35199 [Catharanthus roseus]